MAKKEVQIKSLKLKLGDKDVTLTIEQAKKLHDALDELFGAQIIREDHHHHHDHYPNPNHWWWKWPTYEYPLSGGTFYAEQTDAAKLGDVTNTTVNYLASMNAADNSLSLTI